MLVNDNEYGAPWNDQFYVVTYELDEDIITDTMVLSGPYHYTYDDLMENALMTFGMVNILNIKNYNEVYR